MRRTLLAFLLCGCATSSPAVDDIPSSAELAVEPEPGSEVRPAARCDSDLHRAFDFWIGVWTVETPAGKPAGRNQISQILGGCALQEQWSGAGGSRGTSLNIYDAARGVWHQTWVDGNGQLLVLEGGMREGAMVLRGETVSDKGNLTHEIAWTPLEDGRVRQHWRSSADGGQSWKDVFVGIYRRAERE